MPDPIDSATCDVPSRNASTVTPEQSERAVPIPAAGHMPFFEHPEPRFAATLDFLDGTASG